MNRKELKRKAKNSFRKVMAGMPMPVKRYLTEREIDRLTRPLLSLADLKACQESPERRGEIVERHKASHPKAAALVEQKIREIVADPRYSFNSEMADALRPEIEFACFAYGFQPGEFISFHLDQRDIRTFVSDTERKCLKHTMNDFTQSVFADKAKVYEVFKEWYKRDAVVIETRNDCELFEEFARKHPEYAVKVVNSSRGKGVRLWKTTGDLHRDFEEIRGSGKVLLEELIEQHEALSRFNGSSINTVRVSAYLTRDGVVPGHGVIRTGRSGSFVDNLGSGGIEARIDVDKGVVLSDGIDKFGNTYPVHPDSGVAYRGYVLPDWEDALAIVRSATELLPEVKYKSFDLAYSTKGWVIVEINPAGELGLQSCMETGMKEPLRRITANMDLICKYSLR